MTGLRKEVDVADGSGEKNDGHVGRVEQLDGLDAGLAGLALRAKVKVTLRVSAVVAAHGSTLDDLSLTLMTMPWHLRGINYTDLRLQHAGKRTRQRQGR